LFLITVVIGYQAYTQAMVLGLKLEKTIALIINNTIFVLLLSFMFIIAGKYADSLLEKKKFVIIRYALYAVAAVLATMVLSIGCKWILNLNEPYVSFADFITAIIIAMFTAYISSMFLKEMRMEMLLGMKLDGKEVINEHGAFLGRVVGVNGSEGSLILQTVFDKKFSVPLTGISAINENNLVVKGSS